MREVTDELDFIKVKNLYFTKIISKRINKPQTTENIYKRHI